MKLLTRVVFVIVVCVSFVAKAQERPGTSIEPLRFHHVHLNSVDPAAATAYYPKPFAASAVATKFNGFDAVKTGNVYLLSPGSRRRHKTN
jgi:hypothetical protein